MFAKMLQRGFYPHRLQIFIMKDQYTCDLYKDMEPKAYLEGLKIYSQACAWDPYNDLLTGLLGPYQEIRSPIFSLRPQLARAVGKSENFVFLLRAE